MRSQSDISRTELQTDPAAATESTGAFSITTVSPSTTWWGEATLPRPRVSASRGTVRSIPSRSKMRESTKSCHGIPETHFTTSPAVAYITFW